LRKAASVTLRSRFILLAATTCLGSAAAHAGGFNVARFAGEHGHAASDSVTSLYFNPAGLALGTGWRIYGEGIFALRHVSYFRPELAIDNVLDPGVTGAGTPADALDTNAGTATLNNFIVSPFLGVASDFGVPNLGVGLGLYVPLGGQASWEKNDAFEGNTQYPGAVDGVQRWHTIEGELRSIYFTLGGAYRLPGPRLSFGAGFNLIRSNVDTVRARTAAGTDDIITSDGDLVEGRSHIDVSGTSASVSAGVIWQPIENLWIGASYQAEPGFGNNTQSGTLTNKLGLTGVEETPVRLEQELPDVTRVAFRYQPTTQVELRLSGDYQRWSVFDNQCFLDGTMDKAITKCNLNSDGSPAAGAQGIIINIPRNWNDTFGVRGGGSYWFTPDLELMGGVSYDSSAVPDETIDTSLLDQNKAIVHAGVSWGVLPRQLIIDLTLNNVFYIKREVAPRERDADDNGIGPQPPSSIPDGAGTYKQNVFFVNLGAQYMF
jgi:long-chain fatty acid transport protein